MKANDVLATIGNTPHIHLYIHPYLYIYLLTNSYHNPHSQTTHTYPHSHPDPHNSAPANLYITTATHIRTHSSHYRDK